LGSASRRPTCWCTRCCRETCTTDGPSPVMPASLAHQTRAAVARRVSPCHQARESSEIPIPARRQRTVDSGRCGQPADRCDASFRAGAIIPVTVITADSHASGMLTIRTGGRIESEQVFRPDWLPPMTRTELATPPRGGRLPPAIPSRIGLVPGSGGSH